MKSILEKEELKPLKVNEIIEGRVISKAHLIVYLDLGIHGTGVILGREYLEAKDKIKNLKVGDKILARVVDIDNEDGFVELSLKGVEIEERLKELREFMEKGEIFKVKVLKYNRGGLVTQLLGLPAFLPISQLKERVDRDKLSEYLGKEIEVAIYDVNSRGSVILTQRFCKQKPEIGQIVEGEISGITSYGALFRFDTTEGLIPIFEVPEGFNLKIGEKVKAKLISVNEEGMIFSLKIS